MIIVMIIAMYFGISVLILHEQLGSLWNVMKILKSEALTHLRMQT